MDFDLQSWMHAMARASGFILLLPIFSSVGVPVVVRIALSAVLAMLAMPAIQAAPPSHGWFGNAGTMMIETLAGMALGFTAKVTFGAFELAGQIVTSELGLNMSSVVNPLSTSPTQAPGMMIFILGSTLMFALDLHHWLIAAFVKSYTVLPIGGAHLNPALLTHVVKVTGQIFVLGIQMAAPIMAVSFVVIMVFSLLGRAVPQMNVFSESFAFRIMAGLFVFSATLPLMAQHIANALRRLPDDVMRVAQWLGH